MFTRAVFVVPLLYQQLFYVPPPPPAAVTAPDVAGFVSGGTIGSGSFRRGFQSQDFAYCPQPPPVGNNQTIDKWQQPLSKAVKIPRPAPVGGLPVYPYQRIVEDNTVTIDKWQQPLSV